MNFELKMLIGSLLLLALLIFSFLYHPGAGMYVYAYEVNETPANYFEITMEELDEYPYVKMAVMQTSVKIKVPRKDQSSVNFSEILWEYNRTSYIKINDTYYKIMIISID